MNQGHISYPRKVPTWYMDHEPFMGHLVLKVGAKTQLAKSPRGELGSVEDGIKSSRGPVSALVGEGSGEQFDNPAKTGPKYLDCCGFVSGPALGRLSASTPFLMMQTLRSKYMHSTYLGA